MDVDVVFPTVVLAVEAVLTVIDEFYNLNDTDEGDYNLSFLMETRCFSSDAFRSHFRLSRCNYEKLLQWLKRELISRTKSVCHLDIKLLAVLWLLATPDSYRSVSLRFKIGKGALHKAFLKIVDCLQMNSNKFIKWPSTFESTSAGFRRHGFPGVIGSIDGTYIQIKKPVINGNDYVNRKGYPAITLQAVCDNDLRFTNVYAGWPSSVNDARIFRNSSLFHKVRPSVDTFFPNDTHILGDKAYPLLTWLLTPYRSNRVLDEAERNYNLKHSATRSAIERSFSLLKGRFRRLKNLDMDVKYVAGTIIACCVLHNLCLDESNEDFIREGVACDDAFDGHENTDVQADFRPEVLKRQRITAELRR